MKNNILLLIVSLFFSACGNTGSNTSYNQFSPERPKTAEELRAELKMKEENNPTQYLNGGTMHLKYDTKLIEKHLFGPDDYGPDGVTITGIIRNTASVAVFKDIKIRFNWISETETVINSEDFILYKIIQPNRSIEFSFKTYPPETMRKFDYSILGATPTFQ